MWQINTCHLTIIKVLSNDSTIVHPSEFGTKIINLISWHPLYEPK